MTEEYFRQDNAPCRTFYKAMKWFKDNGVKLQNDLVSRFVAYQQYVTHYLKYKKWETMPKRITAVVKPKGGAIKYYLVSFNQIYL